MKVGSRFVLIPTSNIAKATPIVKGEYRYVLIPTSNIAKTIPIVKGESCSVLILPQQSKNYFYLKKPITISFFLLITPFIVNLCALLRYKSCI